MVSDRACGHSTKPTALDFDPIALLPMTIVDADLRLSSLLRKSVIGRNTGPPISLRCWRRAFSSPTRPPPSVAAVLRFRFGDQRLISRDAGR
jgi:hypothetical protein